MISYQIKPPPASGVISSPPKSFYGVEEVMGFLDCKKNKAYSIIRELRKELVDAGRLTKEYPQGKVPRRYFLERCMIEE